MATEEFKAVTEELLNNYLELRDIMSQKGYGSKINFSFKEYLDHYIEYNKSIMGDVDLDEFEDDLEYEDEDADEVHPSHEAEE